MARLRWGADVPQDPGEARTRLIRAAEGCFEQVGVAKTTVEDVARAAGVSRPTVYRYFPGGRDELVLAVIELELDAAYSRVAVKAPAARDAATAIVEGAMWVLGQMRRNPRLRILLAPDAAAITGRIAGASAALFSKSAEHLAPLLEAGQRAGAIRPDIDPRDAAEWMTRAVISLLTVEGLRRRGPAEERRFLETFLVPALVPEGRAAPSPARR